MDIDSIWMLSIHNNDYVSSLVWVYFYGFWMEIDIFGIWCVNYLFASFPIQNGKRRISCVDWDVPNLLNTSITNKKNIWHHLNLSNIYVDASCCCCCFYFFFWGGILRAHPTFALTPRNRYKVCHFAILPICIIINGHLLSLDNGLCWAYGMLSIWARYFFVVASNFENCSARN